MAALTINGERRECALSALTMVIYELEFDGADLIADISGKVMADDFKVDDGVVFDFSSVPWTKVLRAAWAMLKTVDDSVPHFEQWARETTQFDSWEFRRVVNNAVNENFFHIAAPVGEGDGEEERQEG